MRSQADGNRISLSDSPGCFWLFGGFFCLVGGGAVIAASASQNSGYPAWQVVFGIAMGVVGIGAGLYLIYDAPATRVTVLKSEGTLSVTRRGLLRRVQEQLPLTSVRSANLVQGKDIDGEPVYSLRLELQDGREIPLTYLWLHDSKGLTKNLDALAQYVPRGEMKVMR